MEYLWSVYGVSMEVEYHNNWIVWAIIWDPNKAIDIGEWLICVGGRLKMLYCMYIYMHTDIYIYIYMYTYIHIYTYIYVVYRNYENIKI